MLLVSALVPWNVSGELLISQPTAHFAPFMMVFYHLGLKNLIPLIGLYFLLHSFSVYTGADGARIHRNAAYAVPFRALYTHEGSQIPNK